MRKLYTCIVAIHRFVYKCKADSLVGEMMGKRYHKWNWDPGLGVEVETEHRLTEEIFPSAIESKSQRNHNVLTVTTCDIENIYCPADLFLRYCELPVCKSITCHSHLCKRFGKPTYPSVRFGNLLLKLLQCWSDWTQIISIVCGNTTCSHLLMEHRFFRCNDKVDVFITF